METKRLAIDDIDIAVDALRAGHQIAFPTETVYGLGADAQNTEAVLGIFQAKGRPSDNPLIAHVSSISMVEDICQDIPDFAYDLMEKFWPGPLTLILPHQGTLSKAVTANLDTVGVRMPDHAVALFLIEALGTPIAAPSANRSGKPSPTSADHVYEDLAGNIFGIIDGGETNIGIESTVLDLTGEVPMILRPGDISAEQLRNILPEVLDLSDQRVDQHNFSERPRSPGMKYRHYSPEIPVLMVLEDFDQAIKYYQTKNLSIGILADQKIIEHFKDQIDHTYSLGEENSVKSAAQHLFAGLRFLDHSGAEIILAQAFESSDRTKAYMNRLSKAADGNFFHSNEVS